MLFANDGAASSQALTPSPHLASGAVWLDLVDPTEGERAAASRLTGLRVPSRDELTEIENSARVYREDESAYLSLPATFVGPDGHSNITPVGIVVSPTHLLTLRYEALPSFEAYGTAFARSGVTGSYEAFVGLLAAMVDRMADGLKRIATELAALSRATFRIGNQTDRRRVRRSDHELRTILTAVGACGDTLGNLRDSIQGIVRIIAFAQQIGEHWTPGSLKDEIRVLQQDVASLNDYDQQLGNKVSFLLDAVLGFINIEQNNGVRVLTIASVVGIPPTFVVGLYGMNFKIPEYNWAWGYEYAWALIVVSIVTPLVWFRIKGWI